MWKRTPQTLWRILEMAFVLSAVALIALKMFLDATYFQGYDPNASLQAEIALVQDKPPYTWTKFYYRGARGDRVPAVMASPKTSKGPFPCVIFLHGIGDDKEFMAENKLDEQFVKAGFAFVCFDQLMRGERKQKAWLQSLAAFRVRAACTINDTRRLIDYLVTRPDIAPNRIYLSGASYGAMTGSTAAAFDSRIRAVVLTYGGGMLTTMLSAPAIAEEAGKWRYAMWPLAWYFTSVWDPVKYVGKIAPRQVLLQNGDADTVIPERCARALQEAAREPKTVKWYKGDHLGKTSDLDIPLVTAVLADALAFIQEQDAKVVVTK